MNFMPHPALRCPLDGHPFEQHGACLRCAAGHSFDIARQGYVNLLGAADKRSRDPGDNKAMISARRAFLDAGHYQAIADRLAQLVVPLCRADALGEAPFIVDAGCGEGYYLQQLASALQHKRTTPAGILGFDISKWAVQAATKRLPATWLVASNRHIPLADHSVDIMLSLFGFPEYAEFLRVLRPGGTLVLVNAGPGHLLELRKIIYPDVRLTDSNQAAAAVRAGFRQLSHVPHRHTVSLPDQASINQLLSMTPHLFRASAQGKERARTLSELALGVDVVFDLLQSPTGQ